MKDDIQFSHLPNEWGGPFVWFRNSRGNLELVSVAGLTQTVGEINDAMRARLEELSA